MDHTDPAADRVAAVQRLRWVRDSVDACLRLATGLADAASAAAARGDERTAEALAVAAGGAVDLADAIEPVPYALAPVPGGDPGDRPDRPAPARGHDLPGLGRAYVADLTGADVAAAFGRGVPR